MIAQLDEADCDRQITFNAIADLLQSAFLSSAKEAVPMASDAARASGVKVKPEESQLSELLASAHRLQRQYRKIKCRVRRDESNNNTSNAAARRRDVLRLARCNYFLAKLQYKVRARSFRDKGWARLCDRIQKEGSLSVRWRVFRRTIASGRKPTSSITQCSADDVPASAVDSLNNMAQFYSTVMSTDPIPNWDCGNSDREEEEGESEGDRDSEVRRICDPNTGVAGLLSPLDFPFTPDEVRAAVRSLRAGTAPGPDNINAQFLSKSSTTVTDLLTSVYNASWRHGVVPQQWRDANAFCIYKKGNISDPGSYRLISITSGVMRAFERLVNDRLREHLEGMGFFTPQQAGFRKGLSTLDNIYQLLQVVYAALSQRKRLPVLFLDIVKAFDRVPHSHLLYKLYEQGKVQGKAWGWLRAFLADRRFRMTSGRLCSSWFSASAGVPQGCVLSPLLFAVYINDMDKDTQGVLLTLFADDGCAWPVLNKGMQFRTAMRRMREFGDSVSEWSERWKLRFSPTKTQMVILTRPRLGSSASVEHALQWSTRSATSVCTSTATASGTRTTTSSSPRLATPPISSLASIATTVVSRP